jgi:hypothetical protein
MKKVMNVWDLVKLRIIFRPEDRDEKTYHFPNQPGMNLLIQHLKMDGIRVKR